MIDKLIADKLINQGDNVQLKEIDGFGNNPIIFVL